MKISRRAILAAGSLPSLLPAAAAAAPSAQLPAKSAFARMPYTYLDSASTHPMPLGARADLEEYLRYKTRDGTTPGYDMHAKQTNVIAAFADLVGAQPDELTIVQSTTMGENLVIQALDLPRAGGRIVTDALHFTGSFYTYAELGRAGMDVVTLPMTEDGRISMTALDTALNRRTRLVSISAVSATNGFQHDLKRVCDAAHAHGAYVYVDLIQAAGAVPIDLRAAGVDFAASATYKWLMGDFGLGFLYVRKEVQDRIRRPWWGREQIDGFQSHVLPFDRPGAGVADYRAKASADGRFAMGTTNWTGVVQLNYSLPWIQRLGVQSLQTWRQPLMSAMQGELRRRGYRVLTPEDSRTQILALAIPDANKRVAARLDAANVKVTVLDNRVRIGVAAFNDMNDVDRLLTALPASAA